MHPVSTTPTHSYRCASRVKVMGAGRSDSYRTCTLPPPLHRYLFMSELISLTQSAINGELQQTVNARELHAFLESKQQFTTWIKNRINEYDFVENQDFICVPQKNGSQQCYYD